ncbi:MAG: exosortase N [Williamsia sp.]|nr:exosortase N [Williamsia sp.]
MNYAVQRPLSRIFFKPGQHWLLSGMYLSIAYVLTQGYFNWTSPIFLLGIFSLFLVVTVDKQQTGSARYACAALLFSAINLLLPVKTGVYFTTCCTVMFIIERLYGKTNALPVIVLALMSPFFEYCSNVFTFPLRLQLTSFAGEILQLAGVKAVTEGNTIIQNGNEFSVDPACMGLNMMATSLILGLVLIAVYQKQFQKQAPAWLILLILAAIAGLNILSNLFRIVITVQFRIMPQTWLHELAGIVCLLGYVVLPALLLCKKLVASFGKNKHKPGDCRPSPANIVNPIFCMLIPALILLSSYRVDQRNRNTTADSNKTVHVAGYTAQQVDKNIIKLESPVSLVYLKKIPGFYVADHTPLICWRGSGYEFRKVKELFIQNTKVYSGILEKGNEQLFTIWWYENGQHITTDQLAWRWDVLKGSRTYSVVNITAASEEQVRREARKALADHPFKDLL